MSAERIDFVEHPTIRGLVGRELSTQETTAALVALFALRDAHQDVLAAVIADALKECQRRNVSPAGVVFQEALGDFYRDRIRVAVINAVRRHEQEWHT